MTEINKINETLGTLVATLEIMNARIGALEESNAEPKKSTTKKATTKKTTTKSAPKTTKTTKTTTKKTATATKTTTKKSTASRTAEKTTTKTTSKSNSMNIADFEPCKFKDSDNYVWGGVKGYKAMRSAYCYAKQTNGKARNLADARALGVQIDFDKAWNKAKAEFEKKYKYVKAEDRK